jgi:hypothetical protein
MINQSVLELKIKRTTQIYSSLICVIESLNIPYIQWFIFGDKPSISVEAKSLEEAYQLETMLYIIFRYALQTKIYSHILEMSKETSGTLKNSDSYKIFFSKKRIKKNLSKVVGEKNTIANLGKIYGYPECCIKKYLEDAKDTGSFEPAIRYRLQCKRLNVQDRFFVSLADQENVGALGLFIPCSPKCPEALKILKQYEKIQKAVIERTRITQKDHAR